MKDNVARVLAVLALTLSIAALARPCVMASPAQSVEPALKEPVTDAR